MRSKKKLKNKKKIKNKNSIQANVIDMKYSRRIKKYCIPHNIFSKIILIDN